MRHSLVSLLSDAKVPIEEISRLVGHSGTSVTEVVYRKQIRPAMDEGATAMDRIASSSRSRRRLKAVVCATSTWRTSTTR
jgi:integrase